MVNGISSEISGPKLEIYHEDLPTSEYFVSQTPLPIKIYRYILLNSTHLKKIHHLEKV
jgi:hypothetical protein